MTTTHDAWKLDNNENIPAERKFQRDLDRMRRINHEFAERAEGLTFHALVRFEYDKHEAHPWELYLGGVLTQFDSFDAALECAKDSLLHAHNVLEICDALVQ